ncbi:MAG: carbohydrate ABC transporter permease [Candidatus Atribacteria bacterium]|nr:carbohydrate ABC transporter permease [Candidatus Atribacteria bacterium]
MDEIKVGKRKKRVGGKILKRIAIAIVTLLSLFPIAWIVLTSLKTDVEAVAMPPKWIFRPIYQNYIEALIEKGFLENFLNSVIVACVSIFIVLLVGVPAAYSLARFSFRGKKDIAFWILSTRMAPPITFLIPFFLMFRTLGLNDTLVGLIILHITINLALVIWMMRGFFQEIPVEVEEAAMVDGCSPLQAFFKISVPIASTGIFATAILSFIFSWNELMFAIVLSSNKAVTAPAAIYNFIGYYEVRWGVLCAASVIVLVPVMVFIMLVQKNLIRGLTFGAIK